MRRISHEIHFAWQAQYLVKLEGGPCCYTRIAKDASHVRRINHETDSFCAAGAVFGEVGV